MANLIDTNILVYCFDPRNRDKQRIAQGVLREGHERDNVLVPHQAVVEFVAAGGSVHELPPKYLAW